MMVVGIDLSMTATGVATIETEEPEPLLRVIKSKPDGKTLHSRFVRMESLAASVVAEAKGADLVVIEGPSFASHTSGTWDRAGLWWWVVSILSTVDTRVIEVPPTSLKKWATNKGSAGKTEVALAISKLWPNASISDDNAADALCLATIGAQILGMRVPDRSHHAAALAKVVINCGTENL